MSSSGRQPWDANDPYPERRSDGRLMMPCPVCGNPECEADGVDNGVGIEQCGPYTCEKCGYIQERNYPEFIDPSDDGLPF